jgi:hypothetical protein
MFIALSYLSASAPEERNVTRKPTYRSYGARVINRHTLVYKHLAPPEQRQVSQVCDCRLNGLLRTSLLDLLDSAA